MTQNSARSVALLCVGNGGFCRKADGLYEDAQTARFLVELAERVGSVAYCQPVVEFHADDALSERNLSLEAGLRLLGVFLRQSSKAGKLLSYLSAIRWLAPEIRNTDWVYLFMPGNVSLLCGLLAMALRKPYGVYLRGELVIAPPLNGLLMSRARFVLASSPHLADRARLSCQDVELVSPMVDLKKDNGAPKRVLSAKGPWKLLFVGRVEKRKGVAELLKAAELLYAQGLDFKLRLVGGGPELTKHREALPASLAHRVEFFGAVTDRNRLRELYRDADVFVFPSHDEGFPRVLYEAMAFEVPIITTFVGGIPSVMSNGVNCLRISVDNPTELAGRIQELLADEPLRGQLASEGRRCIRSLMTKWDKSHAWQVGDKIAAHQLSLSPD